MTEKLWELQAAQNILRRSGHIGSDVEVIDVYPSTSTSPSSMLAVTRLGGSMLISEHVFREEYRKLIPKPVSATEMAAKIDELLQPKEPTSKYDDMPLEQLLNNITASGWEIRIPTNIDRNGCAVVITRPGYGILGTGHGSSLRPAILAALKDKDTQ